VSRIVPIGISCIALILAGCCAAPRHYGPSLSSVCPDDVVIFSAPPHRTYSEIGTVSSPGGRNTIPADNYRRIQKEAACLGAVAVILTDQVPAEEPDFWQYPHTGIAIVYATSSL